MRKLVQGNLMRFPIVGLLLLLTSVAGSAQLPKDFSSSYDKFKDETTIRRKASIIRAAKGSKQQLVGAIFFYPLLIHPGQTLQADVQNFLFVFRSESMLCRTWCFHGNTHLIILSDGERLNIGEGRWDGFAGSTTEIMAFTISRKDLTKIAAAKVVEFQIGDFEGKFAENDSNASKTMLDLGTIKK